MKRFLVGLLIGLAVGPGWTVRAQQEPDIHAAAYQAQIPNVDLTLPALLTVLGEYDLIHVDMPVTVSQVWGRTDLEGRRIYIYRSSLASQVSTVIHEVVHVLYSQRGLMANEERVLQDEYRINAALFGAR